MFPVHDIRTGSLGSPSRTGPSHSSASGTYKHESVTQLSPGSASVTEIGLRRKARAHRLGLDRIGAPDAHKPLADRGLHGDRPLARLTSHQLASAARVSRDAGSIRRLGLNLLRGGTLPRSEGRRGVMRSYLASRSAAALLDPEEDEDDATALLTPVRGEPGSARDLAELLQGAGEDRRALAELMEDVEGFPKDPDELYLLLREVRHDPHELAALLRRKQGLPSRGSNAVAALRRSIQDAARHLEGTEQDFIFGSLNAGSAAESQSDPAAFLDAYSELVHGDRNFGERFAQLLERYSADELRNALPAMKRALGDDLAAATHSRDPIRLHAVVSELGHMHVATTLVEMVDTLTRQFARMPSDTPRPALDPTAMLRHVQTVLDSGWATSAQFRSMAADLGLPEGAPMIQLLTGLRGVLSKLPPRVFQDDNVRHATVAALQGALDLAIEQEEESFDEAAGFVASGEARLQ